ncbi:MAG: hypothetical protein IJY27_01695 [Clostridia bacterium]|nr:hypothetical protein [Clostridia bacterium]
MKKSIVLFLIAAITLALFSCAETRDPNIPDTDMSDQIDSNDDNITPEIDSWDQYEQQMRAKYPGYNFGSPESYTLVENNPNGSPDPKVDSSVPSDATASGVTLTTTEPTHKINRFSSVKFVLSKSGDGDLNFYYNDQFRLERQNESGEWERLYYMPYPAWEYWKESGPDGQAELTLYSSNIISPITSGQYRAVIFVGSEPTPVYCNFNVE